MRIAGGMLGTKAITLDDFDNFLDSLANRGSGTTAQELYGAVAWTFWCVNLRANNISQIPFNVYPANLDPDDETDENKVPFELDIRPSLWTVEAWLQLVAASYVFKRTNQVVVKDLQVLNSNTMEIDKDSVTADGPQRFIQRLPGKPPRTYTAEEILYFRTWSPHTDFGPGVAGGEVSAVASSLIKNANTWASSFFENGAIPAVFLTTDGAVPKVEKDRIESKWDKMFAGVRKFRTAVLERGLIPTIVGQPIKDLALPELEETRRRQILASHGIPPGFAEPRSNVADRDSLQFELWDEWLIPWCKSWISPVMNDGLFEPQGLRLSFQYKKIEAVQREEIAKAESAAFYFSGLMKPAYEANLVSIDEARDVINTLLVMGSLPRLSESFTQEDRTPVLPAVGASADGEGPGAGTQPGQNVEDNTRPKALAPEWGRLQVSLRK